MAQLAIRGHKERGKEVIKILEMLGGKNKAYLQGTDTALVYYICSEDYIGSEDYIDTLYAASDKHYKVFTLEEFLEKFPFKVGDKVNSKYLKNYKIEKMEWKDTNNRVIYKLQGMGCYSADELQLCKEETVEDQGNISDGYHTFNELYEYRLLYNASMFNELAKQGLYDVHKSRHHSDGSVPFDDENWFIVQAELPTGQISNHYEMKDWDLFDIPIKDKANPYDGHTPQDVAKRLREFLTPKSKYPKTYEECCKVMGIDVSRNIIYEELPLYNEITLYEENIKNQLEALRKLRICRDAYWKIAGEQMGLGKPWESDWSIYERKFCLGTDKDKVIKECVTTGNRILAFPTEEIQDAFFENFKDLIDACKELL